MDRFARKFRQEMIAEGFRTEGADMLVGPAVPATIHGQPCTVRTCYVFEAGRWEGFASLDQTTPETDAALIAAVSTNWGR